MKKNNGVIACFRLGLAFYILAVPAFSAVSPAAQGLVILSPDASLEQQAAPANASKEDVNVKSDWQTIFSDGFEGIFPGSWKLSHDPEASAYTWGVTDHSSHAGSKSAWCAGSDFEAGDGSYPVNFKGWMKYGPFNLSDATEAEVEFWFSNVCSGTDGDYFFCSASRDGEYFGGSSWEGNQAAWRSHVFDLCNVFDIGNLCGESEVWIAFIFNSTAEGAVGGGAFVDDVVIRKKTSGALAGGISCTLSPAAAAGAQWRVDGGIWRNSGATVLGLAPGAHTVSFKTIPEWTAPADRNVDVVAEQTESLTAAYKKQGGAECGCQGTKGEYYKDGFRKFLGDWLLVTVTPAALFTPGILSKRL